MKYFLLALVIFAETSGANPRDGELVKKFNGTIFLKLDQDLNFAEDAQHNPEFRYQFYSKSHCSWNEKYGRPIPAGFVFQVKKVHSWASAFTGCWTILWFTNHSVTLTCNLAEEDGGKSSAASDNYCEQKFPKIGHLRDAFTPLGTPQIRNY